MHGRNDRTDKMLVTEIPTSPACDKEPNGNNGMQDSSEQVWSISNGELWSVAKVTKPSPDNDMCMSTY